MSRQSLPYFNSLKAALAALSNIADKEVGRASASMPLAVANRLLDYMIVQDSVALKLKADCLAAVQDLLPAIEKVSSPGDTSVIAELQTLCASADPESFERFIELVAEVQRSLFALGSPAAMALCKSIALIEGGYSRKLKAAVNAQADTKRTDSKVSAARNARDYDESALLDFIHETFPQEKDARLVDSRAVPGGYSKLTVGITLSNVKTLPENIILRGDGSSPFGGISAVEEYRLMKTLHANGVCVPQPLAVEESGKVFGSPFMLMQKCPGVSVGNGIVLPPPNKSMCDDIAVNLASFHRLPLAMLGDRIENAKGRTSDRALAWIDTGFATWQSLNMPSPVVETAFTWLRANVGINDKATRTLVHGDYGLNNLLIEDNRVSAILDWEFSHIGNPAYDLGYFYFQARHLSSWQDFLAAYGKAGMPIPDEEQLNYNILLAATWVGLTIYQTAAAFTTEAEPGIALAAVIGFNYCDEATARIASALGRVL